MNKKLKIAVIGATGAVGTQMLSVLEQRKFPVGELVPFASERSAGKPVRFLGREFQCQTLKKGCFAGVQIAFFDASDAISKDWVQEASQAGAWVVDNSATYRMEQDIPLIVPEVNGALLNARIRTGSASSQWRDRVVAGPNCSTVQMVVALKPIHDHWNLKRVVVSTYQSTSGAGSAAMQELRDQIITVVRGEPANPENFTHQIAFNCIPHIGGFKDDGYTSEEQKLMAETRKILGLPGLRITATAIRVPTLIAHAESVNVELEKPFQLDEIRTALRAQAGVTVQDEPSKNIYPMNQTSPGDLVEGAGGRDSVYVGRIRKDPSVEHGLNLWIVSDNLRKGAALNAVQIGEQIAQALH